MWLPSDAHSPRSPFHLQGLWRHLSPAQETHPIPAEHGGARPPVSQSSLQHMRPRGSSPPEGVGAVPLEEEVNDKNPAEILHLDGRGSAGCSCSGGSAASLGAQQVWLPIQAPRHLNREGPILFKRGIPPQGFCITLVTPEGSGVKTVGCLTRASHPHPGIWQTMFLLYWWWNPGSPGCGTFL